jgi:hypothetical protein
VLRVDNRVISCSRSVRPRLTSRGSAFVVLLGTTSALAFAIVGCDRSPTIVNGVTRWKLFKTEFENYRRVSQEELVTAGPGNHFVKLWFQADGNPYPTHPLVESSSKKSDIYLTSGGTRYELKEAASVFSGVKDGSPIGSDYLMFEIPGKDSMFQLHFLDSEVTVSLRAPEYLPIPQAEPSK